jgi:hypothetical protein
MTDININDNSSTFLNKPDDNADIEDIIKYIKQKREETIAKREFSILPLAMKVSARTIGLDLVSVQPLSAPTGILYYGDTIYETEEEKRAKIYKKRKEIVDKLLNGLEKKIK